MKSKKNTLKLYLNHATKPYHLILIFLLILAGCKKTDSTATPEDWNVKKIQIAQKVAVDLANMKVMIPLMLNRDAYGNISFDNKQLYNYYKISDTSLLKNQVISKPKNSSEVIASIKKRQFSTLTPVGPGPNDPPVEDPIAVLIGSGYRAQYMQVTEDFLDLATYIPAMDGIATDMLSSIHVTEDEKVLMYTEIELLKQLATDLETNPDSWITLYAPPLDAPVPVAGMLKGSTLMSAGSVNGVFSGPVKYATGPRRQGCKIDTRGVLASAVIGGFWAAVTYAKVGAIAGTVSVPGVGTVTGAVSGFMAGFAVGFTTGAVTGVIGSLLLTCGR